MSRKFKRLREKWRREDLARFTREHPIQAWRHRAVRHLAAIIGITITEWTHDGWFWFHYTKPACQGVYASEDAISIEYFIETFWPHKDLRLTPSAWHTQMRKACTANRTIN